MYAIRCAPASTLKVARSARAARGEHRAAALAGGKPRTRKPRQTRGFGRPLMSSILSNSSGRVGRRTWPRGLRF